MASCLRPRLWPATARCVALSCWFGAVATLAAQPESLPVQAPAGPATVAPATEAPLSTPAASPTPSVPSVSDASPGESLPEIWYLPDAQGKLQRVIGYSLEDFRRARELLHGGRERAVPGATIDEVRTTAAIVGGSAELRIEVGLTTQTSDWVRAALGLSRLALVESPGYQGKGEARFQFDPEARERVVWVRGNAGEAHRVTFVGRLPIYGSAVRGRLRIDLPAAQRGHWSWKDEPPGMIDVDPRLAPEGTERAGGLIGAVGDFEIAWHPAGAAAPLEAPLLSRSELRFHLSPSGQRADCRFDVRSATGPITRFRIALPPGMSLEATEHDGYMLEATAPSPADGGQTWVEVRLAGEQREAIVELAARSEAGDMEAPRVLSGFTVEGARSQSGVATVVLDAQLQGDWELGAATRTIDVATLPPALRQPDVSAAFEFSGAGFALSARVFERAPYTAIEPRYFVEVAGDALLLEARLRCAVHGAEMRQLSVDMPQWEVVSVEPASLVNQARLRAEQVEPLTIGLARPTMGDFELTIRARRPMPAEGAPIDLTFPAPRGSAVAPARVVIGSADNLELSPRSGAILGLLPAPAEEVSGAESERQPRWLYRASHGGARFVADYRRLPRTVWASVECLVTLNDQGGHLVEQIAYQVEHEPLDQVVLDLPRAIVDAAALKIMCDGKTLPFEADDTAAAGETVRVRLRLPERKLGAWRLVIEGPFRAGAPPPQATRTIDVPLAMPAEVALRDNRVEVQSPSTWRMGVRDASAWQSAEVDPEKGQSTGVLRCIAPAARDRLALVVRREPRLRCARTSIERMLVQSWLGPRVRQERVTLRLAHDEGDLSLRLPAATDRASVELELDGAAVSARWLSADTLAVRMPREGASRWRRLVIQYQCATSSQSGWFNLPCLDATDGAKPQFAFWQVIVPDQMHVAALGGAWSSQQVWRWQGFFAAREPAWEQSRLESWIGTSLPAPPATGQHRYLFSTVGEAPRLRLWAVSRSVLVLTCSGAALVWAIACTYFAPRARRALVLGSALAAMLWAIVEPDLAILAAQAGALGALLAVLTYVWQRRSLRAVAVRESQYSAPRLDTGSRRTEIRRGPSSVTPAKGQPAPAGSDVRG